MQRLQLFLHETNLSACGKLFSHTRWVPQKCTPVFKITKISFVRNCCNAVENGIPFSGKLNLLCNVCNCFFMKQTYLLVVNFSHIQDGCPKNVLLFEKLPKFYYYVNLQISIFGKKTKDQIILPGKADLVICF